MNARFANVFGALVLLYAAPASAHPRIDAARVAYEEADFDTARSQIDDAFDVGHLSRDEYLEALVLRALIASADRQTVRRDDSLRQIAAIAPGYELPAEAPPSLTGRYTEIATELGGAGVDATIVIERNDERFTGRLSLTDPVRVVTTTSIVCRAGAEVFQTEGRDVFGLVPPWQSIECVVQLLGRGGTVLDVTEARADGEGVDPNAPCIGPDCPSAGGGDGLAIGLAVAIPIAVIAGVVLTVVLVLTNQEDVPPVPSSTFILPGGFTTEM